jgi:cyanophycin synthetase
MVKNAGFKVGFTTSDGIYVQNHMLDKGDTTGPLSAEFILKDPTVEFAVLETARGGILRSGLGFSRCDIAVLTNISEDHLGLNDIDTLEDLARVKSVVVQSVKRDGWAVLNADNPWCVKIAEELRCQVAYFSMDETNPVIKAHCKKGGIAAIFENGFITIKKGDWKIRIEKVTTIPITLGGKARFMIENVLAAALAGYLQGFRTENIRLSLETFIPSAALTPGRMNIFEFKEYRVMIDFAHNAAGYLAIEELMSNIDSPLKIGIIAGTGDRRDEDIKDCGRIAARMFDHIIIRQEKHLRGRTEQEIIDLLIAGIQEVDRKIKFEVVPKEVEALKHAMNMAQPGTFITALSDVIDNAIQVVQSYLDKEAGL